MGDSTDVENSPQIDKKMQNKAKFYIRRRKTEGRRKYEEQSQLFYLALLGTVNHFLLTFPSH